MPASWLDDIESIDQFGESWYQNTWSHEDGCQIFPHLQADRLACHRSTDADWRRHEPPGQRFTAPQAAPVPHLHQFALPSCTDGMAWHGLGGCCTHRGCVSGLRDLEFRELQYFIMGCQQSFFEPCPGGTHLYHTVQPTNAPSASEGDAISVF